jgi:DNA-binding CsgD family transcriptional regulator
VAAAETFLQLPEPGTAGRLLHRAARVAGTRREGNKLCVRAVEALRQAGDERSVAAVLRDRTLHRGSSYTPIPQQFAGTATGGLTSREREVAELAARGLTAQEIAEELALSVWTVRHHLQRAREKFGGVPKRKLSQLLVAEA